ncbi:MAG: hypothetical protein ONB31_00130 [candidate division KSB1 bacterium]|nr:hypothetical protein [candidate division KSB1 bacterium]MDZ7336301.1 hypothetical protein [candidate division KSB1 bacterium]MDZ7356953.1 hypothetical protein [candidate division KSB1 bacterium]MDZ7400092.1 hypothetical protein [candidate division KSB1 bacterium]
MPYISKKYRRIYEQLTNFELQRSTKADQIISAEEVLGDLRDKVRPHLFLNFYSENGVRKALEEYGVFKDLNKRGFRNFIIRINADDPYRHTLKAYFEKEDPDHLLGELIVRKKMFIAKPIFPSNIAGQKFSMIVIEWLTLQDPTAQFAPSRPPLPGQIYPGLRMGRKIVGIFINMAMRLKTDGLLNIPEHYHNAVFYSKHFRYFNPFTEGQFQAMLRDLRMVGLFKAAWAVELNCVVEKNSGKIWNWFTDEQVLAVSDRLASYFESAEYADRVEQSLHSHQFEIDQTKFKQQIKDHPLLGKVVSQCIGEL